MKFKCLENCILVYISMVVQPEHYQVVWDVSCQANTTGLLFAAIAIGQDSIGYELLSKPHRETNVQHQLL